MDLFSQRKIYSVYDITSEIKRSLDGMGILWIQGEISNFKRHTSGHLYFSLKDSRAQIKVAFFKNNNMYLKFRPEDGMEVVVRGRLSVYEPRGDYQVIVEYMEPVGLGSLQLAFEQLKEKLRKEGLFEDSHKISLPLLPRKVGIVTSPTGAAIRDMLRILKRRNASLDVLLYPVKVQGQGAAEEIAAGIRCLNGRSDIDVIIIGRGGGSIEDLWAFNEEIVARAIYESELPLISAVGHEVDYTISDFVADLRAPTPSAAAEMVSGARDDLRMSVSSLRGRLSQAVRRGLERRRLHLERLAHNKAFTVAPNKIRDLQQRFDEATLRTSQAMRNYTYEVRHREQVLSARLKSLDLRRVIRHKKDILARMRQGLIAAIRVQLQQGRSRLELAVGKADALSPLAILKRGFALCRDSKGAVVKRATDVAVGDNVRVTLAAGELDCRIENTITNHE
ncbi:MAG TPA: exodeoxyribonuclease VII large subunit [Acidobacteriota bacterium]|nr:exodeoxyribonuclease VII large subunit [Acidobacteriota bacterium]